MWLLSTWAQASHESERPKADATNRQAERASLSDIVDHIDHIVKLTSIDHVGIGSDFDGGGGVNGLEDVSQIENLTGELLRRGYSEKDIAKIWGGNLLRVLGQAKVK